MEAILKKIGLSKGEAKIYEALLNAGLSPINVLHEKTGIERRNIYDILNKLIEKGLVTYITENKRKLFQITHPSKIVHFLEEKENELSKTKKEAASFVPSMTKGKASSFAFSRSSEKSFLLQK